MFQSFLLGVFNIILGEYMKLRHEDYTYASGQIPFILNNNIKRTANLCSESQNWHENVEIQFCKEGEGGVLIDGKCYAFSKGEYCVNRFQRRSLHFQ